MPSESRLQYGKYAGPISAAKGMLTVARDTEKQNKIVGFALSDDFEFSDPSHLDPQDTALRLVLTMLRDLQVKFLSLPESEAKPIARLSLLAVDPDYSGKGISIELVKQNVDTLTKLGYGCVVSECTALGSQRATARNGFSCLSEIVYTEYTTETGEQPLALMTGPHRTAQLVYKKLRP
eukprot:c7427_g1_i2.p1 GENE.c7427_g1_i2~~c7427_g1_i2.p1  ORF type:complete len:179 (+),score=19.00 c7427_g1_i2:220-756(+)